MLTANLPDPSRANFDSPDQGPPGVGGSHETESTGVSTGRLAVPSSSPATFSKCGELATYSHASIALTLVTALTVERFEGSMVHAILKFFYSGCLNLSTQ